jgi:hypothetical protein
LRIGQWSRLEIDNPISAGTSVYLIGPGIPNLILFGERDGKQYRVFLDGGGTSSPPPLPEWVKKD